MFIPDRDPDLDFLPIPDPESTGQKNTIRIRNTAYKTIVEKMWGGCTVPVELV
jgi:hypothetical protein